jgi:peptidoglycan-N-acetylglucosamine deacetylase
MIFLTLNLRRKRKGQQLRPDSPPKRRRVLFLGLLALLLVSSTWLLFPGEAVVVEKNLDVDVLMPLTEAVTVTPGGVKPVYRANISEKKVALTFDISWGRQMPPKVLDILQKQELRCTFFISGPWTKKHPEIVSRIVAGGHEIASHGNEHVNFSTLSSEGVTANIRKAHDSIKEVTGVDAKYIRPPNGDFNSVSLDVTAANEYQTIIWSLDSLDWKNPGVDNITQRLLTRVKPGDIILMHASDTCKQTDAALPQVIEGIRNQGYEFVTLSELFQLQDAKAVPPIK